MGKIIIGCAIFWTVVIAAAIAAFAQDTTAVPIISSASNDQFIADLCGNNGALMRWIAGILGTSVAASLFANFRSRLPPALVSVLDTLALNFIKSLETTASAAKTVAPVMALLCLVGLCASCSLGTTASTPTTTAGATATTAPASTDPLSQANVASYVTQVQSFNQQLTSDLTTLNTGGAQAAAAVGQDVCGAISMMNPLFTMVAPLAGVNPAGMAADAAVMTTANVVCPAITTGSPTLLSDVTTLLGAYANQTNALQTAAPTVAAAVQPPAAPASTTPVPASTTLPATAPPAAAPAS